MNQNNFLNRIFNSKHYPWLVWGLGAAFFCVEYFARLAPSVMVTDLMQAFNTDALGIGVLSGWFYVAYLGMQIPVGVFLDRFGANHLLVFAAFLSGLSCFLLACADSLTIACISRFLIGFGGAFAFVGTLKLATIWFPSNKFGLIAGATQALGMLGATMAEGPLSLIISAIGWRDSMVLIGCCLIVVAFLIAILVKTNIGQSSVLKPAKQLSSIKEIRSGMLEVMQNKQTWLIGLIAALLYGPTAAFGELWGVTYLENVQHLSYHDAANAISLIFLGWTVGGPLSGWFSDRIKKRKPGLFISAAGSFCTLTIVLYMPNLSTTVIFLLMFIYGIMNTGIVNIYALSSEINKQSVSGISMALTNMNAVILGFLFQPVIGYILNATWDGKIVNNIKVYSAQSYEQAVIILPCCAILAFLFSFKVKETHCKRICS